MATSRGSGMGIALSGVIIALKIHSPQELWSLDRAAAWIPSSVMSKNTRTRKQGKGESHTHPLSRAAFEI